MTKQSRKTILKLAGRAWGKGDLLCFRSYLRVAHRGKWLDEEALGVPSWFLSDGCTAAWNWGFVFGPCRRHDFDYWRGASPEEAEEKRREADQAFEANIRANAAVNWDGTAAGWWTREKRYWGAMLYWRGVRWFGGPSFRIREKGLGEDDPSLQEIAKAEGKYWEVKAG